ncbi:hypothetical protein ACP70R_023069 [Stipagrostis hirtigluma subsp. patula]
MSADSLKPNDPNPPSPPCISPFAAGLGRHGHRLIRRPPPPGLPRSAEGGYVAARGGSGTAPTARISSAPCRTICSSRSSPASAAPSPPPTPACYLAGGAASGPASPCSPSTTSRPARSTPRSPWTPPPHAHLQIFATDHHIFAPARISSLIDAAARLAPAELGVHIRGDIPRSGIRDAVELPCLNRTTTLGMTSSKNSWSWSCPKQALNVRFTLPPAGDFPVLESLSISSCYIDLVDDEFSLSYSAPVVEELSWFSSTNAIFGQIWNLASMELKTQKPDELIRNNKENTSSNMDIWIDTVQNIKQKISQFLVGSFSNLEVMITRPGHIYGAMVLHVLEISTFIQRLKVELCKVYKEEACSINCPCDEPSNWRSQNISLTYLKEVEIQGFKGEKHEVDLLKVIFRSAGMLERMALYLPNNISRRSKGCMENSEMDWCSLRDVTNNDDHYKKALEVSNNKSARAMRSLARSAYNRNYFYTSKILWESALALDSLFPTDGWFAYGSSAWKRKDPVGIAGKFRRITVKLHWIREHSIDFAERWQQCRDVWFIHKMA